MLFIFLFNLSGYKAFSFKTRKYSLRFKNVLVSSVVVFYLLKYGEANVLLKFIVFFVEIFTC